MTDDIDALKAALKASPPARNPARTAALNAALRAFDEAQDSRQGLPHGLRHTADRQERAGLLKGCLAMLSGLKLKPVLAATTSAAALGLVMVAVLPNLDQGPMRQLPAPSAPVAETAVVQMDAEAVADDAPALRKAMAPDTGAVAAQAPAVMAEPPMVADADLPEAERFGVETEGEAYANAAPNPVHSTAETPVSTFSVDVDTASYAVIRAMLNAGQRPDPQAVRIEEMINYFPYAYPAPQAGGAPFLPSVAVMPTPWNADTRLVRIALQGRMPAQEDRPPLNLVLLIDTSGSMDDPAKLPLLKQSLGMMLGELRAEDQVAIVAYAGSAGEVLPPTPAAERATILAALDRLDAGGPTAGAEGLDLAYRLGARMKQAGEVSRVLLATDGDFNLGPSDPAALADYIARQRDSGLYLSVLGFGRGNLDDAVMQSLAQSGNGTASYIDTLQEARKVLVDQLTGALFPIADDVKIQVEWNPAQVAEYRLIGYETRALRREDFNNDRVDAGEIGAGHQVTALYEITPPGSPALLNDPLRYGPPSNAEADPGAELGFVRLRYKAPGETKSALIEVPVLASAAADPDARFAAAIAGFGQLLGGASYLGDWGWDQAIELALNNRGDDPFGYRIEAINLMRLAQNLAR